MNGGVGADAERGFGISAPDCFEPKLDCGRAGCARRADREWLAARRKAVFQTFGDCGKANVTCEIGVLAGARAGEEARIAGDLGVRQRIVQPTQVRPLQFGGRRRDDERPWKRRAAADACFFDGLGGCGFGHCRREVECRVGFNVEMIDGSRDRRFQTARVEALNRFDAGLTGRQLHPVVGFANAE